MPGGGHGTLLSIANSLNDKKETKESIKMWINHGYVVQNSMEMNGASFNICDYPEDLLEIWCHALEKAQTEKLDY